MMAAAFARDGPFEACHRRNHCAFVRVVLLIFKRHVAKRHGYGLRVGGLGSAYGRHAALRKYDLVLDAVVPRPARYWRMTINGPTFVKARRLVAWEYAAVAAAADANGIVRGPTPFGLTTESSRVPMLIGAQGWLELYARWSPDARPGEGLRKIFLYPQMLSFYGTALPGVNGDQGNAIPVYAPDSNIRLLAVSLGAAYDDSTPLKPMVYKPRAVLATADVQMRTVGLELCQYRLEYWREEPPGVDNYFQADAAELRLWGQEGQSFVAGNPVERPFYVTVGWEGTANEPNTEDPFLEGDAISVFFRYGSTTG